MKKRGAVLSLFVISVLLISIISSISIVSAIQVITGRIIENVTETTNVTEPEPETCAASISIDFNQDVYHEGDFFKVTMRVFDSQGNPLPNSPFYISIYSYSSDEWEQSGSPEYTNEQGYYEHSASELKVMESVKIIYKVYTEETSSCSGVEDSAEIEVIKEETGEPKPEPEPVKDKEPDITPVVCAAKIEINFDKDSYAAGDSFKVEVGVFDSQENPLPNYPFYVRLYDNMWHSADLKQTDSDGYFKDAGEIPQKTIQGVTKGIFHAYTKEIGSCESVEDTTEISLKKPELVPCGMGSCVPVDDEEKEPIDISDGKGFYGCMGCEVEDKCYPIGYRKDGKYCSDNDEFMSQVKDKCDNNFECESNLCLSGECVSEGFLRKVIEWIKKRIGVEPKPPELKKCSKLLIEKDIKDNEYINSGYGGNEHTQVPVHSEDGKNIGTIKCCVAEYSTGMVIVCPFDNKEEVRNSLRWILGGGVDGSYSLGEYEGEKVVDINNGGILVWTNKNFLIASGGKPEGGGRPEVEGKFVEDIVNAYLKKYPSSFDITADEIPYVLQPENPETWISCTSEKDMLTEECHLIDDFESGLKKWTFSNEGLGYDGTGETLVEDGNTVMRLVGVNRANIHRIWDNYLFKFRFKMIEGYVHVDFRRSETPGYGAKRYVVSINDWGVLNLNREINQDFQKLENIDLELDDDWHTLEVRVYNDIINVYVDNELVAKHKDTISPLASGWVRFEAHTGGRPIVPELLVDDVEIKLITEEDIISP